MRSRRSNGRPSSTGMLIAAKYPRLTSAHSVGSVRDGSWLAASSSIQKPVPQVMPLSGRNWMVPAAVTPGTRSTRSRIWSIDGASGLGRPQAQEEAHGESAGRLEAEVDANETRERAQEQAGAHQENDCECDLRDYQDSSHAMMTTIRSGSPSLSPQHRLRIDATRLPRRHQAEGQRRRGRHHECEEQAARIQTDRLGSSSGPRARGQGRERVGGPKGDHDPGCPATRREHGAFDDELSDETSSTGTERRTHGKLAATTDTPGHQEPGDIRARDCEHDRYDRHQQPERGAGISHEELVEPGDEHPHPFIEAVLLSERRRDRCHLRPRGIEAGAGGQAAVALESA